jgi:prevent-host-death family protein
MPETMKKVVNIHQAKTELSQLIADVLSGEKVVIAKAGIPVARLVPAHRRAKSRRPGTSKGQVWIAADFNAPLPDEALDDFES